MLHTVYKIKIENSQQTPLNMNINTNLHVVPCLFHPQKEMHRLLFVFLRASLLVPGDQCDCESV